MPSVDVRKDTCISAGVHILGATVLEDQRRESGDVMCARELAETPATDAADWPTSRKLVPIRGQAAAGHPLLRRGRSSHQARSSGGHNRDTD